jgi:hypothetical protein
LRKVKGVAGKLQDIARNTLVQGCIDRGAYIQFGADMGLYNLWSALNSAKSYEEDGMYSPGSAQRALDAVLAKMGR